MPQTVKKSRVTVTLAVIVLSAAAIAVETWLWSSRKYYLTSVIIILLAMLPFFARFEVRRPQVREIVLLAVMTAFAVAGRVAFYWAPQFKPVCAIVILTAVAFNAEAGFITGAAAGLISNMFFGQGPWTPWQMFAFGSVGFLAGVLFQKGWLRKTKASLCVFGFLATFVIYGCIMNTSYVIQSQTHLTKAMFIAALVSGAPFDLVHAVSTVFFLWIMVEAMIEKLERIKEKYGLLE